MDCQVGAGAGVHLEIVGRGLRLRSHGSVRRLRSETGQRADLALFVLAPQCPWFAMRPQSQVSIIHEPWGAAVDARSIRRVDNSIRVASSGWPSSKR